MRTTLLALVISIALPCAARADDLSPGRAFTLRIGAGGDGLVGPDRLAPVVLLSGLLPIGEWAGIEIGARVGVDPELELGRGWVGLEAGFRAEIPLGEWRPYASVRIAHTHDAPIASWGDHFGESLAGDPTYGMAHLTALGGALGLAWTVPRTEGRLSVSWELSGYGRAHGHHATGHHGGGQHRSPDGWLGATAQIGWMFL